MISRSASGRGARTGLLWPSASTGFGSLAVAVSAACSCDRSAAIRAVRCRTEASPRTARTGAQQASQAGPSRPRSRSVARPGRSVPRQARACASTKARSAAISSGRSGAVSDMAAASPMPPRRSKRKTQPRRAIFILPVRAARCARASASRCLPPASPVARASAQPRHPWPAATRTGLAQDVWRREQVPGRPTKNFDQVAAPPAEDEKLAAERILAELLLHQHGKAVETFSMSVMPAASQIRTPAAAQSSAQRPSTRRSAARLTPSSIRIRQPSLNSISIDAAWLDRSDPAGATRPACSLPRSAGTTGPAVPSARPCAPGAAK